jgi:hypothetical protein
VKSVVFFRLIFGEVFDHSNEVGECVFDDSSCAESSSTLNYDVHSLVGVGLDAENAACGADKVRFGRAADLRSCFDEANSKPGFTAEAVSDEFDVAWFEDVDWHPGMRQEHGVERKEWEFFQLIQHGVSIASKKWEKPSGTSEGFLTQTRHKVHVGRVEQERSI